jgi:hypothetical protein
VTDTSSTTDEIRAGFVDPPPKNSITTAHDWHLSPVGPAIDAGDPFNHPATDIDGDSRPSGVAPDAGADEEIADRLYVSTTGTGTACTSGDPCGSLDEAYAVASPGDVVVVAAGSYGAQTIEHLSPRSAPAVVFRPARGASPSFSDLTIDADHVTIGGPFEADEIGIDAGGTRVTDVTLHHLSGGELWISNASDVLVRGGDYGSVVIGSDPESADLTFDRVDIHGAGDEAIGCMHAANVQGMTVRDSMFRNCGETDLVVTDYLGDLPPSDRWIRPRTRSRSATSPTCRASW